MAKADRVRALTSFVYEDDAETVVVHDGDVFASTHPAVKAHPELFENPPPSTSGTGGRR